MVAQQSTVTKLILIVVISIRIAPFLLQGFVAYFILIPCLEVFVFVVMLLSIVVDWQAAMYRRLQWFAAQPGVWAKKQEQRLKERARLSIRERRLPRRSKRIYLPAELFFYEIMRMYIHKGDHLPYALSKSPPETYIHFVSPPRVSAFIKVHEQQGALVEIQLLNRRAQVWARRELYRVVTICHWDRFRKFLHLIGEDLSECPLYPASSADPNSPLDVVEMIPAARLVRVLILAGEWVVGHEEATRVFSSCRWIHTCELELVRQVKFRHLEMLKNLTSLSISSVVFDTPWRNNDTEGQTYEFPHLRRLSLSGLHLDRRWGALSVHEFFLSRPKLPSLVCLSISNCNPITPLEQDSSNPSEPMLGPNLAHQLRYLSIDRPYFGCGPDVGLDKLELLNVVVNGPKGTTDRVFPFWDPSVSDLAAQAARATWEETLRMLSTDRRLPPVPRRGAQELRLQLDKPVALTPAFWTYLDKWLIERVIPSDLAERYRSPLMKLQRTQASHRLVRLRLAMHCAPKDPVVTPPCKEMKTFLHDLGKLDVDIVWEASLTAVEMMNNPKTKLEAARPFKDPFHRLVWGPTLRLDPRWEEEGGGAAARFEEGGMEESALRWEER
ncbi:BQ2448_5995 [Microbotryum intermedium]|uniref:BQ2448_5995 protein n=1 Tax=Microbotryum intermedium TaxID=269621 RepID=A0A238F3N1_9BASI|nr:BQ2448_5995 [Microbotryum intermedium]